MPENPFLRVGYTRSEGLHAKVGRAAARPYDSDYTHFELTTNG